MADSTIKTLPGSRSTFRHPFPRRGGINQSRFRSLIEQTWKLNRSAVNPDTDQLAKRLRDDLGAEILEVPAGTVCLTSWRIPENWVVRKAQLRRLSGTAIADFANNPLYLWTHSISFNGKISRKELFANHLQTDPQRPDEFLYHYRNGFRFDSREWGFSLPYRIVEEMTDETYEVEIDTDLDLNGSIKVVDAFLPGELPDTIFFMAHTCHPALVADGIGCIAVAAEIYHQLKERKNRKYSYRFLFGPEYFAAAAYLERGCKEDIAKLRFGLFLDMLTTHEPIGFQPSMQGNSRIDLIIKNVLKYHAGTFLEKPYRQLWGNDETFYNGPGFMIPSIGVGRGMFREYHYDTDDLDHMNMYHAEESAWMLSRMVEVFETDYIPVRKFNGPLYLSRYGLYIDPNQNSTGAASLERMLTLIDGERSCMDLAVLLDLDFYFVRDFCNKLISNALAERKARQPKPTDAGTMEGNKYEK